MKQQINLLNGFKALSKPGLSAELILKIAIVLFIVLVGLQTQIVLKQKKLDEQYEALLAVQELRGTELAQLSAQLPDGKRADIIRSEVENLTRDITHKKSLLNIIDRENYHFSNYMRALAKRIIPGIWLKEIHINQADKKLELLGRTVDPDLVPLFLAELTKEPIFAKVEFKQLKLAKPADKKLSMGFALRTIPNEETVYIFPEDVGEDKADVVTTTEKPKSGVLSSIVSKLAGDGGDDDGVLPSLADVLERTKEK